MSPDPEGGRHNKSCIKIYRLTTSIYFLTNILEKKNISLKCSPARVFTICILIDRIPYSYEKNSKTHVHPSFTILKWGLV